MSRARCEKKCEVYARVVGFYTPINQWNKGKAEEYTLRKTFKLDSKKIEAVKDKKDKSVFSAN